MQMFSSDQLIAPCGMNCGICYAHLREKKQCAGCNFEGEHKPKHCETCVIVTCEHLPAGDPAFCYDCEKYPCRRLKQLDQRYRKNYGMSMLENLNNIKQQGLKAFLASESERWSCRGCGSVLSVHRAQCLTCGLEGKT